VGGIAFLRNLSPQSADNAPVTHHGRVRFELERFRRLDGLMRSLEREDRELRERWTALREALAPALESPGATQQPPRAGRTLGLRV
jgi:hypothetical protein